MKVSKGMYGFISGLFIGFVMSFAISFVLVAFNVGFVPQFPIIWLQSALVGFFISIPVGALAFPIVESTMSALFQITEA